MDLNIIGHAEISQLTNEVGAYAPGSIEGAFAGAFAGALREYAPRRGEFGELGRRHLVRSPEGMHHPPRSGYYWFIAVTR